MQIEWLAGRSVVFFGRFLEAGVIVGLHEHAHGNVDLLARLEQTYSDAEQSVLSECADVVSDRQVLVALRSLTLFWFGSKINIESIS